MMNDIFYCPIGDIECPYYDNKICKCENPVEVCDDAAFFLDEENTTVFTINDDAEPP